MKDQRIEASKLLSELAGMENAPWVVLRFEDDSAKIELYNRSSCLNRNNPNECYGPHLRIEDGNPWSSAAILARTGYMMVPICENLWRIAICELDSMKQRLNNGKWKPIVMSLADQETANILGICKLYEIDRKAYDKGMEILLETI